MSYSYRYPHPAVTVDVAIFAILDKRLQVLLIRRKQPPFAGMAALPGGFVGLDESLKHAAWRELKEETGVSAGYLEQLHAFGNPNRDPRERVISVAYYSVVPADSVSIEAASDAADAGWYPLDEVPELAFDHARILARATAHLQSRLEDRHSRIVLGMLPETFTLAELQQAYECIIRQTLDKRNFRKRMLALNVIEATGNKRTDGAHRPAALYRGRVREVT